jgi:transposase
MASDRIEIITGTGRRKSWRLEEKVRLVAEASTGRGAVSAVSRRYGVCRSLLFRWRRQAARGELGGPAAPPAVPPAVSFLPVEVMGVPPKGVSAPRIAGAVAEVVLENGRMLRVAEGIAPERLAGLVAALDHP